MNAKEHAKVWLVAAEALKEQMNAEIDKYDSPEIATTTMTAYKLAFTIGIAYKAEAENAPN